MIIISHGGSQWHLVAVSPDMILLISSQPFILSLQSCGLLFCFLFFLQFWISSFSDGRIQLASSCTSGVSTLREMGEPFPHASGVGCSPLILLIGMKCGWHCWFSWSHTGYFYICVGVVQPHKSSCLYVMSFELWIKLTGVEKKMV